MSDYTPYNAGALKLDRCPHCRIANPLLAAIHGFTTTNSKGGYLRKWRVYVCSKCGGAILGAAQPGSENITEIHPSPAVLQQGIPEKAAAFLRQAMECIHAPSGAIMLCASSVDAMLKDKGLKEGSLYKRVEKAADTALITKEMSLWAHEVRLDANDERHADDSSPLPDEKDANRCIEFTKALALFLFVLPAMVEKGRKEASPKKA